ncbi:MAG: 2-oxoacid:acceptor oxidoreductase subunit alpha [Bacteroidales bacterium]|nr:2-oxoacid:acceptor oxidoreductase subunit alpha [Bacteroidales bacterium]MCF8343682.1 2-oxoacid:acceptor oxidoreductase subunit alpha [Bacteroidales bacterium]MCF8351666.1 2-oxoacid:acceptor oxidoreductase subunit alpha [Bacteroidales bacterium]MCF8374759.1 2-oxoacid:acceptor oxidoreductase subunit alpha [Bacteroidales bacterium]MCF8399837.1 2-oxoacid:acceptor oxidoreductase subunit alpha [Bacteroidales bacterium]
MGTKRNKPVQEKDDVVIRFAGDSGDGMQLTGSLFSDSTAFAGNDFATFPDYPAEIRAPQGTIAGVSGFQVHFGHTNIHTSGDLADVLVAMNPASLKANLKWLKDNATVIVDTDAFVEKAFDKAGYDGNPLEDETLEGYRVIHAPISEMTRDAVHDLGLENKVALKSKNMFALGIVLYLFNRKLDKIYKAFEEKFKSNPLVVEANKRVLRSGYNFADTVEAISPTFNVEPAELKKGLYRNITGNTATAWGFIAASERSGRELFLGSYPITPASEILQELTKHKELTVKAFQAEDEIAGICSAIGASYTGSLAITTTSGPGLSLKSEAIGLAVMTELPIVIVDVQRGGPSTGLPTKSEQSDLMQALFGRNGECPTIVMAASSPTDCFYSAYHAAKISMEHMTPVILLTDGSLANGSEIFRIPRVADLMEINPPLVPPNDEDYKPYKRDEKKLNRRWAVPGTEGLRHRIGGLEKENIEGNVSHDPENHQLMTQLREEKVNRVADFIPEQELIGDSKGDLLIVSWGGTKGVMLTAVEEMHKENQNVSLAHFNHINPLPKNTEEIFSKFKKIVVCELNNGQFVNYLKMKFPEFTYQQYNKIQGLPFMVSELKREFYALLSK